MGKGELRVVQVCERAPAHLVALGGHVVGLFGALEGLPGGIVGAHGGFHGGEALANADAELAFRVHPLEIQLFGLYTRLLNGVVTLSAGEDGNAQVEHQGAGRQPFPLAQIELVALGIVVIAELHAQGRQVGILLHADLFGQHFGLGGQLAHLGVAVQRGFAALVDVVEHVLRIILQAARHIYGEVQIHTHHRLQLPKGQENGILGIVQVGDGGSHIGLGAGKVHLGGLLGIVSPFGELAVLYCILVHGIIYIVGSFGHEHGVVGLLHRRYRSQAAFAGLFHGQFHLVAREAQALPKLEIHHRHGGRQAQGDLVAAAHLNGTVPGLLFRFRGCRGHIRDKGSTRESIQLLNIVHDGLHHAGHHAGHAAAGGAASIVGIGAEVNLLLLDGIAVHAGCADLREKLAIGAFTRILGALYLHIGHFYGNILGKGNLERVVQRKHQRGVRYGALLPSVLSPGRHGDQQRKDQNTLF